MDKFKFVMPAELEKSKDGSWKVRGLASSEVVDKQGETIIQKGIDLTPIDERRGVLNWDHQKGPENTLGLLDGYKRLDKGLYIEGRLFKNHTKAKAVKEIMESLNEGDTGRMGLSVEGQILERDPTNPKIIKKCKINAVALTMNPVNSGTFADLVKSMNSSEVEFNSTEENITEETHNAIFTAEQVVKIVEKALGVGAGYTEAPSKLKDGSAMAQSDMKPEKKKKKKSQDDDRADGQPMDKCYGKMKKMSKSLYKSSMVNVLDKLQKLYPDNSRTELWSVLKERLQTRFPSVDEEIVSE